jgi:Fe2+ transport system protein B
MKQLMKIIGVKVVHVNASETSGIVELTLAPKEMVKRKPMGIMDLVKGDVSQIMDEVGNTKQFETRIYMGLKQYLDELKNQPLSDVWLEITLEQLASDIAKEKVK